jgi:dihydrodipicolinate synthase/N-acetylneuraminate lyase
MATALPEGCWPTMITPYNADGAIDYPVLDALIGVLLPRHPAQHV